MKHPHISTGSHDGGRHYEGPNPRFVINTSPGKMEPIHGVNLLGQSALERHTVIELRDELNAWLEAHPTLEDRVGRLVPGLSDVQIAAIINTVQGN